MKRRSAVAAVFLSLMIVNGCSRPFSEQQSARLVDQGDFEGTMSYSSISFSSEGESEKVQDDIGVRLAYGVSPGVNLRLRYERISVAVTEPDLNVNVWAFGPKFSLKEDAYAFYLPIGFATGEDVDWQETFEMHPTIIQTIGLSSAVEVNTSLKCLLKFNNMSDPYFAFNFGLGLGPDLTRVVLRPEVGIMINPGSDGMFWHWSLGMTVAP